MNATKATLLIKQFIKSDAFFTLILVSLITYTYYALVRLDPLTKYDDSFLIDGIKDVHSIKDYIDAIFSGKTFDIQPVRDLSYYFDLKLISVFPSYSFHFTNLFIFLGILLLFKSILSNVFIPNQSDKYIIWSLVFLYAFSPVTTSSVAWVAARKHLLSTFFVLWATFLFLKKRHNVFQIKDIFCISFLFFLSGFSQPINAFWPLFLLSISIYDKKLTERYRLLLSVGFVSFFILLINYLYYMGPFVPLSAGSGKFDPHNPAGIAESLLAIGRYFYLTLFPFDALPVSHDRGSWQNLAGLMLFPAIIFSVLKFVARENIKPIFCYLIYFFIPLIPVASKITRIFCWDTYILNASIGIYIIVFIILKNTLRPWYLLVFLYSSFLFFFNLNYVKVYMNPFAYWEYSYTKESTAENMRGFATVLIEAKKFVMANAVLEQLLIRDPFSNAYTTLKSNAIYFNHELTIDEKIARLERVEHKIQIVYMYLTTLYFKNKNINKFKKTVLKVYPSQVDSYAELMPLPEKALAIYRVTCEVHGMADECKKAFLAFTKNSIYLRWKKEEYEKWYFTFKKDPYSIYY